MLLTNNYDQSSTGINIQLSLFRDEDQARELFRENLKEVKNAPHKNFSFYEYTIDPDGDRFEFTDPDQYSFTRADLNRAIRNESGLVSDLCGYLGRSPFSSAVTKSELLAAIAELLQPVDLAIFMTSNFTQLFDLVTVSGFSQGDYAAIVYSRQTIRELSNGDRANWDAREQSRRDECANLLFNQPVWGRIEITRTTGGAAVELFIDELMADPYEYDKDQIIEKFEIRHGAAPYFGPVFNFLQDKLPEYL